MAIIIMVNFSIYDAIANDNPVPIPDSFEDWISKSKKLQVQPTKSNRELTAAKAQTEKYPSSIFDSMGLN
jgi:hypothetical protein